MKSIALLFIILFSTLIIFYDPPVGYQEIRRLDSLAAKNSEVNVEWREFLKTNPSPTSSQIREIKSIIEEVAVLNESSVIIGKPLLSRKFTAYLEAKNQQAHADLQIKQLNDRLDKFPFKKLSLQDKAYFLISKKSYWLALLLLPMALVSIARMVSKPY